MGTHSLTLSISARVFLFLHIKAAYFVCDGKISVHCKLSTKSFMGHLIQNQVGNPSSNPTPSYFTPQTQSK